MAIEDLLDNQLYEMSNYGSRITGLPYNIKIWLRSEPKQLPHNNYRVKIEKDGAFAAIFSVGENPTMLKSSSSNKLTGKEISDILEFIRSHSSRLINHIDGVFDSGELAQEILRARG